MKAKTILCVVLVLVLAGPAFGSGSAQAASTDTSDRYGFNQSGYPVVDEKVTFSALSRMHPLQTETGLKNMPLLQEIEEVTNVRVDAEYVPASAWNERLNLIFAAGELPDLIVSNIPDSLVVQYYEQGFFQPLSELVQKYAPNVQQLFSDRPAYYGSSIMPDGELYSLPGANELRFRAAPDMMYINQTWLDKLNLDPPTTTAELVAVLRAFKEGDPNGNGQADEIPLSAVYNHGYAGFASLFGGFGLPHQASTRITISDGVVHFAPIMDGYREGLVYLRELYTDRLLDPEVFTHNLQQYYAKGNGSPEVYGLFFDWFGDSAVGAQRMVNDYVPLAPIEGPGGQAWPRNDGFLMKNMFLISSSNTMPEVAIRWVDYLYDPLVSLQLTRGQIGPVLQQNADGTFTVLPAPQGTGDDAFRLRYAPAEAYPYAARADMLERISWPTAMDRKLNTSLPLYEPYLSTEYYPMLTNTREEVDLLATLTTDIHGYVDQMVSRFIMGDASIENEWARYVETVTRMGVDELVGIYQTAYDRFLQN